MCEIHSTHSPNGIARILKTNIILEFKIILEDQTILLIETTPAFTHNKQNLLWWLLRKQIRQLQ